MHIPWLLIVLRLPPGQLLVEMGYQGSTTPRGDVSRRGARFGGDARRPPRATVCDRRPGELCGILPSAGKWAKGKKWKSHEKPRKTTKGQQNTSKTRVKKKVLLRNSGAVETRTLTVRKELLTDGNTVDTARETSPTSPFNGKTPSPWLRSTHALSKCRESDFRFQGGTSTKPRPSRMLMH